MGQKWADNFYKPRHNRKKKENTKKFYRKSHPTYLKMKSQHLAFAI